jgi:ribonuclease HII
MADIGRFHPQYGFSQHKGYATRAHYDAVRLHGLSPVHRKTFFDNEKQQMFPFADVSTRKPQVPAT